MVEPDLEAALRKAAGSRADQAVPKLTALFNQKWLSSVSELRQAYQNREQGAAWKQLVSSAAELGSRARSSTPL